MASEKLGPQKIEPIKTPEYQMPTEVYFGRGQVFILPDLLMKSSRTNYLLVVGGHFSNDPGYADLRDHMEATEKVTLYKDPIKKSTFEEVDKLVRFVQDGGFDGVIGIGGGAVLDSAKVAAALAVNGGVAEDYLVSNSRKIEKKGLLYIAVPTTAGTGSEVTPWSVLWGDKKYSLSSPEFMFPDVAIVDAALTDDCPKEVTATSGIDAMVQAVEAYWNVNHNPTSDKYALESVRAILGNIDAAVNSPTDESRDQMAYGSLTGGLAFSNTATTICHSVSYPMTLHWGIPHGQATSITLPAFIEYSFGSLGKREKAILDAFGVHDAKAAAGKVTNLLKSIGLKTRLSELGIPREGIKTIISEGFDPARAGNAPRVPTPDELGVVLTQIY